MNLRDLMIYPVSQMALWQVNRTEVDSVKKTFRPLRVIPGQD